MASFGVDVVVINDESKVLLTKRQDFPVWCLPGGGIENGESIAEAAIREVYEETGIQIRLVRLVGIYSVGRGDHVIVFVAYPIGGVFHIQPSEVTDIGYFAPHQLPEQTLAWHRIYLDDALSGVGGSVVKTLAVRWPFDPELDREQLYAMRDRGEIAPAQIAMLWAPLGSNLQKLELDGE